MQMNWFNVKSMCVVFIKIVGKWLNLVSNKQNKVLNVAHTPCTPLRKRVLNRYWTQKYSIIRQFHYSKISLEPLESFLFLLDVYTSKLFRPSLNWIFPPSEVMQN